jgi:hypothetical protein
LEERDDICQSQMLQRNRLLSKGDYFSRFALNVVDEIQYLQTVAGNAEVASLD